jgi:predicted HAD superfamily Cof-like phosphohydrolase
MTKEQQQVCEFMKLAGQETPDNPTHIDLGKKGLRSTLIREELEEYEYALSMVEIADAIADLLYVVIGTAVAHGIDIDPVFQEVHRSNMSKFIDGHRREDGKWVKGPSYSPANIAPILERQGL